MKKKLKKYLKWSERYTETDMSYIAKGGFWLVLTKAGLLLASFLTMLAFGNLLSAEAFGTYQYIISATVIAGVFSLNGINTAIVKSVARGKEGTFWRGAKERFRWSLIGSAGLLAGAGWYFFAGNMLLAGGFLIAGLLMPGEKIFQMFTNFWNGRKDFKTRAGYHLSAVFLSLLVVIPVIYWTDNVVTIIFAYFLSHVLFEGLFFFKTLHHAKNDAVDEPAISFGKNLSIMSGFSMIASHIDKVIVWQFLGPVQVAIYSFAVLPINKLRGAIPITDLALPKLGEKDMTKKRQRGILKKMWKLLLLFISIGVILALIAPYIYELFFPKYLESIIYFQALAALIAISGPIALLNSVLIAEAKTRSLYLVNIASPLLKIALFVGLIPFYGIWGMVWAILFSEVFRGVLLLYFFNKI